MSLDTFIAAVTTKIDIESKKVKMVLSKIFDIAGVNQFVIDELVNTNIESRDILQLILDELLNDNYITVEYYVECENTGGIDTVDTIPFCCDLCSNHVNYGDTEHSIKPVYTLIANFRKEVTLMNKDELFAYIQEDYYENFLTLKRRMNKVIPFLGAGISTPFKLPNWIGMLHDMERFVVASNRINYRRLVDRGAVFQALDYLCRYSGTLNTPERIQSHIAVEFRNPDFSIADEEHIIKELLNLSSDFYLTTNYDMILNHFWAGRAEDLLITEIENIHLFKEEKRQKVVHVHGMIGRPSSMIVTQSQYEGLYQDSKYTQILSGILSEYSLLFVGFSYQDEYFKQLHGDINKLIGGEHFLIVPNADLFFAQEYAKNGISVIGLNLPVNEQGEFSSEDYNKALKYLLNSLT
ncbi:SIR2 family NAD-dependent protein deacylase [Paenibacillus odorifer]|uniref:SIR2 family NAD-dependent protein deacylase n=1 Tax=Paenibacillus odorifer TaxID=189426 RepID=UPI00097A534A|nr:SIR2 family protein [Paenibacillus odorifer]OME10727.1 hypothetical protein BSK60_23775 [Paenibacillus odorifer]